MTRMITAFVLYAALIDLASLQPAPEFDFVTATPSVVVATSRPGAYYAAPEACTQEDVVCMQYPLWFLAEPIQHVYGISPTHQVDVTTYTHYGQPKPDDEQAPRILLLIENNGRFMMPVYANQRVWLRSDGQYYFFIDAPYPTHWLPCSVDALREQVDPTMFSTKIRIPLDDPYVEEHPELFLTHAAYATPRFGISVRKLEQHLRELKPSTKDFRCGQDAVVPPFRLIQQD